MVASLDHKQSWKIWLTSEVPDSPLQARFGSIYRGWKAAVRSRTMAFGLCILAALIILAVFAPLLTRHSPIDVALDRRLLPPSSDYWFGTDELGRDIFTRITYGARITLSTAIIVAVIVAPAGLLVGTVAGYSGGWIDRTLMRLTDIFLSFPRLVLALALVTAVEPGIGAAIFAIAVTSWPPVARIARAETLVIRKMDYIHVAEQQGASRARILLRYIAPMCTSSVVVRVTLDMANIILIAAGLGFLGLGVQPPVAEWGAMLSTGREHIYDSWWVATFPGIAILLASLALNLVGDGIRDVLDPRHG